MENLSFWEMKLRHPSDSPSSWNSKPFPKNWQKPFLITAIIVINELPKSITLIIGSLTLTSAISICGVTKLHPSRASWLLKWANLFILLSSYRTHLFSRRILTGLGGLGVVVWVELIWSKCLQPPKKKSIKFCGTVFPLKNV